MKKNSLRLKTLESKFDKQFLLFKKIIDELEQEMDVTRSVY